jgi:hypothetical protein
MRKLGLILGAGALIVVVILGLWIMSRPERGATGSINTKFRLLGPNDKIVRWTALMTPRSRVSRVTSAERKPVA